MSAGHVIAILGAESTGKTTLARELAAALAGGAAGADARVQDATAAQATPPRVAVVEETLRDFCDRVGRTPRQDEQQAIADAHSARIEAAASSHDLVVADTTALQTAVYSDWVFGDRSLYPAAQAWQQRHVALTLLTGLDLPWVADGLQRDGAHVREPIDAMLRAGLDASGAPYAVVLGSGSARLDAALAACRHLRALESPAPASSRWRPLCERCGEPDCERHLLRLAPR